MKDQCGVADGFKIAFITSQAFISQRPWQTKHLKSEKKGILKKFPFFFCFLLLCVWICISPAVFAFFLFLFFVIHVFQLSRDNMHYLLGPMSSYALFTDLQVLYSNKNKNKNESYDTIHTFKNYFITIFSVFTSCVCVFLFLFIFYFLFFLYTCFSFQETICIVH